VSSNETKQNWGKAWSGRFKGQNSPLMERFNASIQVDTRLWEADILGNLSWVKALAQIGIITAQELSEIETGLAKIRDEFKAQQFQIIPNDEDIHMAIERRLIELIGPAGGKIHTGRSRNDQVVTDFRLYLKTEVILLIHGLQLLQQALLKRAEEHLDVILPGYTHLQQAQPVLLSHYWLSFFFALQRDVERIEDYYDRLDVLPLGSGAFAGSAFPIDREFLAEDLGFSRVSDNSIDAVSDRDFVIELLSVLTQIQIHLSRYAEDLIIWSSYEFGFVELDDAWATGSSIMPQKKNPDSLELIRGKAAFLIGAQTQLSTLAKGLPLTYAKDLQEDKFVTFQAIDAVKDSLQVFTGVMESLKIFPETMRKKMNTLLLATDIADYLARKGVPFRESHAIVGNLVQWSLNNDSPMELIPFHIYQEHSDAFSEDVYDLFSWEASVENRNLKGGTGREAVEEQIELARQILNPGDEWSEGEME
jgi:argininosuccinate lyase